MKENKKICFVRWGGLSLVKQKGYKPHLVEAPFTDFGEYLASPHSPPARRGIYAFIWPYIDIYLLSGDTGNNHVVDKNEKLLHPRKFNYYGPLWHHFGRQLKGGVIARRGWWVKTSFEDFVYAMKKEIHYLKKSYRKEINKKEGIIEFSGPQHINSPFRFYSKDMFEVFIDEKI